MNTYALFAELFVNLTSPHGRAGVIAPTGVATDANSSTFFAHLLSAKRLVSMISFDNRRGLFRLSTETPLLGCSQSGFVRKNPFLQMSFSIPRSCLILVGDMNWMLSS